MALLVMTQGCDDSGGAATAPAGPRLSTEVGMAAAALPPTRLDYPEGEAHGGLSVRQLRNPNGEETMAYMKAAHEMELAIRVAVVTSKTWQEADRKVRAELDRHPGIPQFHAEQVAAQVILRGRLLTEPVTQETQRAIGYWTSVLVDNDVSFVEVMSPSLDALTGYWDGAKIAAAARQTLENAEPGMQRGLDCAGCTVEEMARDTGRAARRGTAGAAAPTLTNPEDVLNLLAKAGKTET